VSLHCRIGNIYALLQRLDGDQITRTHARTHARAVKYRRTYTPLVLQQREGNKDESLTHSVPDKLLKRPAMPSQSWLKIDVRAETLTSPLLRPSLSMLGEVDHQVPARICTQDTTWLAAAEKLTNARASASEIACNWSETDQHFLLSLPATLT
jgi:hypothetical protein